MLTVNSATAHCADKHLAPSVPAIDIQSHCVLLMTEKEEGEGLNGKECSSMVDSLMKLQQSPM